MPKMKTVCCYCGETITETECSHKLWNIDSSGICDNCIDDVMEAADRDAKAYYAKRLEKQLTANAKKKHN